MDHALLLPGPVRIRRPSRGRNLSLFHVGILQGVDVDGPAQSMVGQPAAARDFPVAKGAGIVSLHGQLILAAILVNQPHGGDGKSLLIELLKDIRNLLRQILVHHQLPRLRPALIVPIGHLYVGQGGQHLSFLLRQGCAQHPFLNLPGHLPPLENRLFLLPRRTGRDSCESYLERPERQSQKFPHFQEPPCFFRNHLEQSIVI